MKGISGAVCEILLVAALKQYLGVGNWVWWIYGICAALDQLRGFASGVSE